MVVTFPYAFGGKDSPENREYGELFVRVTRKYQPSTTIVQMTDETTAEVSGVDSCFRTPLQPFPGKPTTHKAAPGTELGLWYFDAMAQFPADEFLRLDYDVMMRKDVSHVFDSPFDIAVRDFKGRMNNGVVFVKNRELFKEARANYLKTEMDNWQDCQTAMQMTIDSGLFRVRKLDETYNMIFDPHKPHVPEEAKLMHFKGWRKGAMLDHFK